MRRPVANSPVTSFPPDKEILVSFSPPKLNLHVEADMDAWQGKYQYLGRYKTTF
jgi:hypothetical protein